jgi:hypothetical protein
VFRQGDVGGHVLLVGVVLVVPAVVGLLVVRVVVAPLADVFAEGVGGFFPELGGFALPLGLLFVGGRFQDGIGHELLLDIGRKLLGVELQYLDCLDQLRSHNKPLGLFNCQIIS